MMRVSMVALAFGSLAPTVVVATWMVRVAPPRSRVPSSAGTNWSPVPVMRMLRSLEVELLSVLLLKVRLPLSTRVPVGPVLTAVYWLEVVWVRESGPTVSVKLASSKSHPLLLRETAAELLICSLAARRTVPPVMMQAAAANGVAAGFREFDQRRRSC